MKGSDFFAVERTLRAFDGEAYVRTRIGRLYYGVFLELRQYCEARLGYSRLRMAREHQAIANVFQTIDPVIADALRELRKSRNLADYEDDLPASVIEERVLAAMSLTQAIMDRLDVLKRQS